MLTSRATIGACAINTKSMTTNQWFANLVCSEKIYNWFLFYKISALQNELEKIASGSTFKEISKKNIKSLMLHLAPLPEQKKIAEILTIVDEVIDKQIQHKEQLDLLKKSLVQVLLTGKVRVNV